MERFVSFYYDDCILYIDVALYIIDGVLFWQFVIKIAANH